MSRRSRFSRTNEPERIQKLLANCGLGSRREIERWIITGRLFVNGKAATLGDKATLGDQFSLDQQPLTLGVTASKTAVIMLNKATGTLASRDDTEDRPSVLRFLPDCPSGRWIMVGRLDINTEGLLLFTNDGDLAHRLMHPRFEVERVYRVRLHGQVDDQNILNLLQGVELDDGLAKFESMEQRNRGASNHWFDVQLKTGRNRVVRRLWESQGCQVNRLIRIAYGPITLPDDLPKNQARPLTPSQIHELVHSVKRKR